MARFLTRHLGRNSIRRPALISACVGIIRQCSMKLVTFRIHPLVLARAHLDVDIESVGRPLQAIATASTFLEIRVLGHSDLLRTVCGRGRPLVPSSDHSRGFVSLSSRQRSEPVRLSDWRNHRIGGGGVRELGRPRQVAAVECWTRGSFRCPFLFPRSGSRPRRRLES